MGLEFTGKAYSVGDGFCYEGMIEAGENKRFHFVTDCGSQTPRNYWQKKGQFTDESECEDRLRVITDEIAAKEEADEMADLLILTHLHADHYNGLKRLLKKRKFKTIVMPYRYPAERLISYTANI